MRFLRVHAGIRCVLLGWLVLLGVWSCPAFAASNTAVVTEDTLTLPLPGPWPSLRETTRRAPEDWLSLPFGFDDYADSIKPSRDAYWHKLEFQAQFADGKPRRFQLVADTHILRHLEFHVFRGGQRIHVQENGLRDISPVFLSQQRGHYNGVNLPLDFRDGDQITVLVRKQNDGPCILPLKLVSAPEWSVTLHRMYMVWGAIIAVQLMLALYNALIYAMNPGPAYRWYLMFHGLLFFYMSGLHGYGFLLWPSAFQVWLAQSIMPMNFLLVWLVLKFGIVFLDAKSNARWHFRHQHWFTAICLPGALAAFWIPEYKIIPPFGLVQLAGSLFIITMGIQSLRRGFRPAWYFLASWLFTAIGAGIGIATFAGQLPVHFLTLHAFAIGAIGELLLLSLALADRIKFMEYKALWQAYIDPQTRAPNYSFFKNRFPEQLPALERRHSRLFLLVIELQGFRELVGLLGPDVLQRAYDRHVERCQQLFRNSKWSVPIAVGDGPQRFVITLPGGQEMLLVNGSNYRADGVQVILDSLLALTQEPVSVNNVNTKIGFRIGCAPYVPGEMSIFECFRRAQVALLTAQRMLQPFAVYSSEQDAFIRERLSLLSELRMAIIDEALSICIQPQIRMRDGQVVGGEVLVRWHHPELGPISPGVFIPLAEQTQLVFDITQQVLHKTCVWLNEQQNLPSLFHLSVNLSALDISDRRLLPLVSDCVRQYGISPQRLLFEVTESAVMDDPEHFITVIRSLHDMGFRIAIDDFGTGYSSMTYMQRMNADEIKIDMSFVRGIQHSATNQNIVRAIIQLAAATGAHTVAEGIEHEDERAVLMALDCTIAQGYLWSPAVPPERFAQQYLG